MCTHVQLSRPLRRRQIKPAHGHANVCGLLGTKGAWLNSTNAACLHLSRAAKRRGHHPVTPSLGEPASVGRIPRSIDRRD